MKNIKIYSTVEEWRAEGKKRFGEDIKMWRFKCPKCGHVATGQDFYEAGAIADDIYCNCIGRFKADVGCDWAAYGLFDICTTKVKMQTENNENGFYLISVFEFDDC